MVNRGGKALHWAWDPAPLWADRNSKAKRDFEKESLVFTVLCFLFVSSLLGWCSGTVWPPSAHRVLSGPAQACGIWPTKQLSFKIKALKVDLVWEQFRERGIPWHVGPSGLPGKRGVSFSRDEPNSEQWCRRTVSWLMSLRWFRNQRQDGVPALLPLAGLGWAVERTFCFY